MSDCLSCFYQVLEPSDNQQSTKPTPKFTLVDIIAHPEFIDEIQKALKNHSTWRAACDSFDTAVNRIMTPNHPLSDIEDPTPPSMNYAWSGYTYKQIITAFKALAQCSRVKYDNVDAIVHVSKVSLAQLYLS